MLPATRPLSLSSRAHAWLVLSRGSNLPTVWSNCLGGWWLSDGGTAPDSIHRLCLLLFGTSALYTAGMWLNDAYDSAFDARFRPERPIPAGAISRQQALYAGAGAVLAGWCSLAPLGMATMGWTLALTLCIVLYNRVHKRFAHASWLMAGCRFLLYPLAASASAGVAGWTAAAAGAVLAFYVAGITYLARGESLPDARAPRWPWLLLCIPLLWRLVNAPQTATVWWSHYVTTFSLAFWLWRAWRQTRRPPPVADLLAGIVLVDLLLIPQATLTQALTFAALFAAARLFQRLLPAT